MNPSRTQASKSLKRTQTAPEEVQEERIAHGARERVPQERTLEAVWESVDRLTQTMELVLQQLNSDSRERVDTVPRETNNALAASFQVTNGSGENNGTLESEPVGQRQEANEKDSSTIDPNKGWDIPRMQVEAMVPKFNATVATAFEAKKFLKNLNAYFGTAKVPDRYRVQIASTRLESGETMDWYIDLMEKFPGIQLNWIEFQIKFKSLHLISLHMILGANGMT